MSTTNRRAGYHEEQAALREALELGTATTHAERMLPIVEVTVSAASIVVMHVDAPNYRPPSTNLPKKERDERRHASLACVAEWSPPAWRSSQSIAGGALDAVELEDESSDGGGGVATALPGRSVQRSASPSGSGRPRGPPVRLVAVVVGRLVIFHVVVFCCCFL